MSGTYKENKRRLLMHILAILFVLVSLGLALGIIGGMLFAHRARIIEALSGRSPISDSRVTFVNFAHQQPVQRHICRQPIAALLPLPLAA
jgi:uncharacterized protein YneF (UPF0154 family)